MLLIPCPWCGPRDETEFACGGQSHIQRPKFDGATEVEWCDYLFFRINPKGVGQERWVHVHGCRRWFNVARDTVTHEIEAVYQMGESTPSTGVQAPGDRPPFSDPEV